MKEISGINNLNRSRVGEIAREALLSYRQFYPDTIILIASPYNSKLLMAQFANQVKCLYCYRNPINGDYNCNDCPSKRGDFFDIERMHDSVGSQTPITNIDLDSFLEADSFFENLGIHVEQSISSEILNIIKQEPIYLSSHLEKNNQE